MQISTLFTFAVTVAFAAAGLHKSAVCVNQRKTYLETAEVNGMLTKQQAKNYEISLTGTKCACNYYHNRNTGTNKWDTCPDCKFDGLECKSAAGHIGGDEFTYYCESKCGTEGAEAD